MTIVEHRRHRNWSTDEDNQTVRLRGEGYTAAQIALVLGRTKYQVQWRFRQLVQRGLTEPLPSAERKRRAANGLRAALSNIYTEAEDANIRSMRLEGRSVREISARLGRPFASVATRIHVLMSCGYLQPLTREQRRANYQRARTQRIATQTEDAA